jgi:hypothetical protein
MVIARRCATKLHVLAAIWLQRLLAAVYPARYSFYMSEVTAVLLEEDEVRSLNEQVARLEPGEPYLTVIVDGKAIVRATRGISQTLLQLWRREPAMMVPDSFGYHPETRHVDLADL